MTEMEMTGLLLKLADLGITGITISYEGSGDSGQIEQISYLQVPVETLEEIEDLYDNGVDYSLNLSNIDSGIATELENFAYETLLENIEDWYNNDGGFGFVAILVKTGEYRIHNNVRYYETRDYQHEGKLIERTEQ